MVVVYARTDEPLVNCGHPASCGTCLPPPNAYGTRYSNGIGGGYMHNGGGAYRYCGMYSPPPPPGGEFGQGEGYGYYGGRYGGGGRSYDDLPLGRRPGGATYGGLGVLRRHGPLGGAVRGLGMGMSKWCARCWRIRFRRREHSSPLRPIPVVEAHSMAPPALAVATVRSEVVQVQDPVVPVWLRETPRALVGSLGCSPSALVEVRAMRAVLTARLRLRLRLRLVVLERMRRGMPKQLGDGIELV